ncbi:MAG: ribonuclease H-like domain-containing protein [Gemmatimonadota bacterium]
MDRDLQARIDALARRRKDAGESDPHSSAEVARALRSHRRAAAGKAGGGRAPLAGEPAGAGNPTTPSPGPHPEALLADTPGAIVYRRDLPRRDAGPRSAPGRAGSSLRLEDAVDGTEVLHPCGGRAFETLTRVDELEGARRFSHHFGTRLGEAASPAGRRIAAATSLEGVAPADLLFFDIETTGLSNSPLFLIGAMVWEGGGLVVRQYMARNYAEEAAVIALFGDLCRSRRLLVSFNGKSFDLPFIRVRAAANRVALASTPAAHFDLLHECRRVWREVLPDCRLQTLELHVCRRLRRGDIPSAEIPRAYHQYVRTADAGEMVEVLKHNMLDLVTLADLMTRLPPMGEPEGGA